MTHGILSYAAAHGLGGHLLRICIEGRVQRVAIYKFDVASADLSWSCALQSPALHDPRLWWRLHKELWRWAVRSSWVDILYICSHSSLFIIDSSDSHDCCLGSVLSSPCPKWTSPVHGFKDDKKQRQSCAQGLVVEWTYVHGANIHKHSSSTILPCYQCYLVISSLIQPCCSHRCTPRLLDTLGFPAEGVGQGQIRGDPIRRTDNAWPRSDRLW